MCVLSVTGVLPGVCGTGVVRKEPHVFALAPPPSSYAGFA